MCSELRTATERAVGAEEAVGQYEVQVAEITTELKLGRLRVAQLEKMRSRHEEELEAERSRRNEFEETSGSERARMNEQLTRIRKIAVEDNEIRAKRERELEERVEELVAEQSEQCARAERREEECRAEMAMLT